MDCQFSDKFEYYQLVRSCSIHSVRPESAIGPVAVLVLYNNRGGLRLLSTVSGKYTGQKIPNEVLLLGDCRGCLRQRIVYP